MNKSTIDLIEADISAQLSYLPAELRAAMSYSALGGGKRLRGYMLLEVARHCGGAAGFGTARPLAVAIELIHAYSLVHDDLPAMDNSDTRRGKASCHKQFGEWQALLCGDALLTHAFAVISKASLHSAAIVDAVRTLSVAAGAAGMIDGQWRDSSLSLKNTADFDNALKETLLTYEKKTGRLFTAAAELGVIGSGGSMRQRNDASEFGRLFGLAFQLRDDLDDLEEDKALGRTTAATILGVAKTNDLISRLDSQLEKNQFSNIFD